MFGTIGTILGAMGLIAFLLVALNKRTGASLWHWGRTKSGEVGKFVEGQDAVAQMRQATDDAAVELQSADHALQQSKKLMKRLADQIEADTKQINRLREFIRKKLEAGVPENDTTIVAQAMRLKGLIQNVEENQAQHSQQLSMFDTIMSSARRAAQKINNERHRADILHVKLETSQLSQNLLGKYNPDSINNAFGKIDKYATIVEDQIASSNAAIEVQQELYGGTDPLDDGADDISDILADLRPNTETSRK